MSLAPEQNTSAPSTPLPEDLSRERVITLVAYGLYALTFVALLPATIVALVINYIKVTDAPALYASHHRWMIRTFWWGLGWSALGGVLIVAMVGFPILFAVYVWWIYRLVRGFLAIIDNKPI